MDRALVLLDARVADAAEAWLTDPRDSGVYARLVAAVTERRAYLDDVRAAGSRGDSGERARPRRPTPAKRPGWTGAKPAEGEPDEGEPAEGSAATVRPVGDWLAGDPRIALERLRRGQLP